MSWGMDYDRFWVCSWSEFFAYMRAQQIRDERQTQLIDTQSWQQGQYILDALLTVYPFFNPMVDAKKVKKHSYPKLPYLMQEKQKKEREKTEQTSLSAAERVRRFNESLRELKE